MATRALQSEELAGSRVFFTQFDRITYSQVAWTSEDVAALKQALERRVKLLLFLKCHIVVPASHLLESELARELFLQCPRLFRAAAVVPALRGDSESARAFLDAKRSAADRNEAAKYESTEAAEVAQLIDGLATTVHWSPGDTSSWFRERLIADLRDGDSLVGLAIRGTGTLVPAKLLEDLAAQSELSRGTVYRLAKATGVRDLWNIISEYADFLYYLGGARAVRSEGVLPQENLMDFSVSDLAGGRTRLSEHDIFVKLLIDIIKAATSMYFPTDFLDAISVNDALDLHSIALQESFIHKYNAIQARIKEGLQIRDPERLVLTLEELADFESELHGELHEAIMAEVPAYRRAKRDVKSLEFLHALASCVIPFYGAVAGSRDLVVSGLRLAGRTSVEEAIARRVRAGLDACDSVLDRRSDDAQPILLGFVQVLRKRYAEIVTE